MPPATERALKTAITRRVFDPVYYLHGDDDFRKEDALTHLLAAAIDVTLARRLELQLAAAGI